jgi:hypothetical protein
MYTPVKDMNKVRDFVTRRIGAQTLVVPLTSGVGDLNAVYSLNETGAAIWQMLRGRMPLPQIVDAICRQFEVSAEEAAGDIRDFMDDLHQSGLIDDSPTNGA